MIAPNRQDDLDKAITAEHIQWDESMMIFHPLLEGSQYNGFYPTPEDLAEALESVDCDPKYKVWGFATTAEGCQSFDLSDLIESASQDMHEDWCETVLGKFCGEIAICQAALDRLHESISEGNPTWRVDYSRVVLLPVGATVSIGGPQCCLFCLGSERAGMTVCQTCGNKRCPKATSHDYECTGSNEPGQAGSVYA